MKKGGKGKRLLREHPEHEMEIAAFFQNLSELYSMQNNQENTNTFMPEIEAFTFDFMSLPILGEIALTYRCNNRCLFCYAGCSPESDMETMPAGLSTSEWKTIIDIFKNDAKIPFFSFTGGEPTLRTDLEELIRYAGSIGLETNLVSNGTLISEARAKSLRDAGLETAQISVESPHAATHDALTGRKGSHGETLAGIRALQKAGVEVQTNTTINTVNAADAPAMPAFLKTLGIERFAMNMYIPLGRKDLFIDYANIGPIVDRVRKAAFNADLTFYWYSPTPFCRYNPIARGMGNKSCAACDGLISVSPKGEILPCSSWSRPLGNLLEKPLKEIWFSEAALKYKHKEYAPPECKACSAFSACQGACPIYWDAVKDTPHQPVIELVEMTSNKAEVEPVETSIIRRI
jgi:radical SAM protein with 4Fe4S-binding SPASM domain